MPNKKSFFDSDNRQLTDVFKELQETRLKYEEQNKKMAKKVHNSTVNNSSGRPKKHISSRRKTVSISLSLFAVILAFIVAVFWSTSISAKDTSIELYSPLSDIGKNSVSIEINRHRINAHNIITSNSALETVKEQVVEERDIPFETLYTERNILPKGEEVVLQEGINGKKNVTLVRSYENGEL